MEYNSIFYKVWKGWVLRAFFARAEWASLLETQMGRWKRPQVRPRQAEQPQPEVQEKTTWSLTDQDKRPGYRPSWRRMRSGSRGCPVAQQGGSCHPCAVLWHHCRPCVRSRRFCVRVAVELTEGDGISALSVALEPPRAIFRLPCIPSRHLRRRAVTKQPEGDVSEALSVTLAPSRAIFRLPRMISQHSSVRSLACPPHDAKSRRGTVNSPVDSL